MKFKKILPLLLILPLSGVAQTDTLQGAIRYLVVHNWTKKLAAVDYISKQRRERAAYVWGNRSEWKSYTTLWFSATQSKYEDSEERAEADDRGFSWRKDVFAVRRNFADGTTSDALEILEKTYLLEDSMRCQNWKIQNDLKEVAGHLCMRATTEDTLKMQKIEAWFALDLPGSMGPERFCGLPGVILEVNVNNGGMLVTADKIDLKPVEKELAPPKKKPKGKRITETEYAEMLRKNRDKNRKDDEEPYEGVRY